MYRKFIATITAASIAITAFGAAPAYADRNQDFARAAAAILGIVVVGKIIHDKKKKKEEERVISRRQQPQARQHKHVYKQPPAQTRSQRQHTHPKSVARPQAAPQHRAERLRRNDDYRMQPRPLPQRVNRKLLPGNCFRSFDTRRGRVQMFGRQCLENNFRHADNLPRECAQRVRTTEGVRHGFDARCLRDAGYSLARG